MPKTKQANEQIKKQKRELIMNSAIQVFARKGYAATCIEDIAQNAGVSVGLIYRYFVSKEELYGEIVDYAIDGLKEMTALASSSDTPEQTMQLIASIMLAELDNKDFINLNLMVVQSTIMSNSPRFDEILQMDKRMFEATATLIQKGQQQGVFAQGDPLTKSVYFFSSIMGLIMTRAIYSDNYNPPSTNELVAFLYR